MANASDIVGWAYEADVHCGSCTEKRFPGYHDMSILVDNDGNEITPIFNGEDAMEDCGECGGTGQCNCSCPRCGKQDVDHECYPCDGTGKVSRSCGDCGEELVS